MMTKEKAAFIELSAPSVRRKYTKLERQQHCEAWKRSGKSRRAYCHEHGITHSNFNEWLKQIEAPLNSIHEKQAISQNEALQPMELILASGLKLRFSKTSVAEIIQLIKGLESCS